jgi:hypothetical protein
VVPILQSSPIWRKFMIIVLENIFFIFHYNEWTSKIWHFTQWNSFFHSNCSKSFATMVLLFCIIPTFSALQNTWIIQQIKLHNFGVYVYHVFPANKT